MRLALALVPTLIALSACGGEIGEPEMLGEPPMTETIEPESPHVSPIDPAEAVDVSMEGMPIPEGTVIEPEPSAHGYIGSRCSSAADCDYDGAVCLQDAFPHGSCSLPCDRLCPDRDGFPVTFCAHAHDLPGMDARALPAGACLSRCDFAAFPGAGCRMGYGCVPRAREGESSVTQAVCVPGEETMLSSCQDELVRLGVDYTPTTRADAHPADHPNLTCHINEPVILHPPIHGVDVHYYDGSATPNITAACNMALAFVKTVDDLAAHGVVEIRHYGTYNCRVIAGTDTLSRHGKGDAIDLASFKVAGGARYSVLNDFEQDDATPETTAGVFLYDAVHRWHDRRYWSIILTPNYNAAHRNHFHVDLTPGSDFLGLTGIGPGYIGPAPYDD